MKVKILKSFNLAFALSTWILALAIDFVFFASLSVKTPLNLTRKMLSQNYRGIALLPILPKVLERQVYTRLYQHVSGFLYSQQHGFRKRRSCITQLLQFVHTMAKSLDDGIHTDVIYLYMAKAFDKVPHEKLLHKLEMVGVRDPLLVWLRSYLASRRHRTVIDGFASDWRYAPSGVPKGSHYRPSSLPHFYKWYCWWYQYWHKYSPFCRWY